MVNLGDIVFFRKCKKTSKPKQPEFAFKGNGFAIFLGHVPLFAPDPPAFLVLRMLGQTGFISFDDLKSFLPEDQFQPVLDKFTDKYWGRKTEDVAKEAVEKMEERRKEELKRAEQNALPVAHGTEVGNPGEKDG